MGSGCVCRASAEGNICRRWWALLLHLAFVLGCATDDPLSMAERFDLPRTGPTTMARVAGGYELKNRQVRVLIDDTTGDVRYWGDAEGERNLLEAAGAVARLDGMDTPSAGYIEKRDDQTWQYLGEDAFNQVTWRKIYCLEGSSLLVTYIVQNSGIEPLRSSIVLEVALSERSRPRIAQPDLHEVDTELGRLILRGFRESPFEGHVWSPQPAVARLVSDTFSIRPVERFSFTTEWRVNPDPRRGP